MWFSHSLLHDAVHTLYILTFTGKEEKKKHYSSDNSKKHEEESQAFKGSI